MFSPSLNSSGPPVAGVVVAAKKGQVDFRLQISGSSGGCQANAMRSWLNARDLVRNRSQCGVEFQASSRQPWDKSGVSVSQPTTEHDPLTFALKSQLIHATGS